MVVKRHRANSHAKKNQPKAVIVVGAVVALGVFLIVAWNILDRTRNSSAIDQSSATVQLNDIHGLGFSADGRQLLVPAHDGIVVFAEGRWRAADLPINDYMGYSASDTGFYSSGHPGRSSNRVNPLGLIKSTDGGKTLTTLGFEGETDFHVMGVGYKSHVLYVFNPRQNSGLSAGMHYTLNDGKTWSPSRAQGINGNPIQIAVHPSDPAVVVVAAETGLFLSTDYGQAFANVGEGVAPITAAAFHPNGKELWFGFNSLRVYDLTSKQIKVLQTPAIQPKDGISYIAINPITSEIVFATFSRDLYLSANDGQSWQQIAEQGVGKSNKS